MPNRIEDVATLSLPAYVAAHTDRGECDCGKCFDRGSKADPTGHVADMVFYRVAAKAAPDHASFLSLTGTHSGEFGPCNPLDGQEYNYIELGGWLGSQDLALRYMALGSLLGVFDLLTPFTMFGKDADGDLAMQMAGMGMVAVQAKDQSKG